MEEALFDLQQVLRSRKDKITSHEVNILMECKGKALRDFSIGSTVAAGVAWLGLQVTESTAEYTSLIPFDSVIRPSLSSLDEIQRPGSSITVSYRRHSNALLSKDQQ